MVLSWECPQRRLRGRVPTPGDRKLTVEQVQREAVRRPRAFPVWAELTGPRTNSKVRARR